MTKFVVRPIGGLGNQIFGYAAARRLALVNEAELVIDDVSGFTNDCVVAGATNSTGSPFPAAGRRPRSGWNPLDVCAAG